MSTSIAEIRKQVAEEISRRTSPPEPTEATPRSRRLLGVSVILALVVVLLLHFHLSV